MGLPLACLNPGFRGGGGSFFLQHFVFLTISILRSSNKIESGVRSLPAQELAHDPGSSLPAGAPELDAQRGHSPVRAGTGKPAVRNEPRGWRKRGQDLMAICHDARKGRYSGSHWSKPARLRSTRPVLLELGQKSRTEPSVAFNRGWSEGWWKGLSLARFSSKVTPKPGPSSGRA